MSPPVDKLHRASVSRSGIEGQVNYAFDYVRRQEACETSFDECCTLKKRLTTVLGGRYLGAGRCPVAPPLAGHSEPIWETVSIVF